MSEKISSGNTPRKPEWFELTDSSAPSAQVRKINKIIPSIAVLAAGMIIGIGSFFASGANTDSMLSSSTAKVIDESVSTAVDIAPSSDAIPGGVSVTASNGVIVQEPAGIGVPPPRGGGDDDDDDYEDEDEDDDDEEDEDDEGDDD